MYINDTLWLWPPALCNRLITVMVQCFDLMFVLLVTSRDRRSVSPM